MVEGFLQLKDINGETKKALVDTALDFVRDVHDENYILADVICSLKTNIATLNILLDKMQAQYHANRELSKVKE